MDEVPPGPDRRRADDAIADGLLAATLPQAEWTHAAHVAAGYALCRRHGHAEALRRMREAIPRLNEAHGIVNDDVGGYHETLTVFFMAALADAVGRGATLDDAEAALPRDAALAWWSRERLFAVEARRAFVEPDRARPPFPLLPEG